MALATDHTHLHASYDLFLVGLSYGLAALGSFAALASATRIRQHHGASRLGWAAVTALALGGGGIWSMHFVGMVAYHIDSEVSFDLRITMLSLLIAVVVAGIGLWLVAADPFDLVRLVGGGLFAGLGVAAMHYTGMAAMRTTGTIGYDRTLVAVSIVIAVVAAIAAFWIAFHIGGTWRVVGASLVMAVAVCGMHYTGMAATQVTSDPRIGRPTGFDPLALGILITIGSTIILMFIIVAALGGVTEPHFNVKKVSSDEDEDEDAAAAATPDRSSPHLPGSDFLGSHLPGSHLPGPGLPHLPDAEAGPAGQGPSHRGKRGIPGPGRAW